MISLETGETRCGGVDEVGGVWEREWGTWRRGMRAEEAGTHTLSTHRHDPPIAKSYTLPPPTRPTPRGGGPGGAVGLDVAGGCRRGRRDGGLAAGLVARRPPGGGVGAQYVGGRLSAARHQKVLGGRGQRGGERLT